MRLIFLGTGGGRHSAMFQIRSTGGTLIQSDRGNVHIDPGAGALTKMNEISYDLQRTDAIIVSHCHPDHYSDAPNAIEGMTKGGWVKRGSIYASRTCIEGCDGIGPAFMGYHLSLPESVHTVSAGETHAVSGIRMEFTEAIHNDPTSFGIRIHAEKGVIGYVTDTEFAEGIAEQYKGSRLLVLPLTVPDDRRIKGHMDLCGAIDFIRIVRPELVIFNHLGIRTVEAGPDKQAKIAADATGVPVVAAKDLMAVDLDDGIGISQLSGEHHDWLGFWTTSKI